MTPVDVTCALWATWCMWSLQWMHEAGRAYTLAAAGSAESTLKALRSLSLAEYGNGHRNGGRTSR